MSRPNFMGGGALQASAPPPFFLIFDRPKKIVSSRKSDAVRTLDEFMALRPDLLS